MGLIIGTIEPHEQVRQFGYLELNNTRAVQPSTLAFVGLDDFSPLDLTAVSIK